MGSIEGYDLIGSPLTWAIFSIIIGFTSFFFLKKNDVKHSSIVALMLGVANFFCYLSIVFAWTLRDGLGPDSVASTGSVATDRFFDSLKWLMIVPASLVFGALVIVYRERKSKNA